MPEIDWSNWDKRYELIAWDIRREGRSWAHKEWRQGQEWHDRYHLSPDKIESVGGKLFWNEADRLTMLGLLLENVGIDRAIRFGDPKLWREAVAELGE